MIYLDYSATTPVSDTALDAYNKVSKDYFANTMGLHNPGTKAANLLEGCRGQLAQLIQGKTEGIYFTSGGSESNQLAIESLVRAHQHKGKHIIVSPGEHSSVMNTLEKLKGEGYVISFLPLNGQGEATLPALQEAIHEDTILVVINHVNSDVGTIQNIEDIGSYLHRKDILFHCDVVQSFGKLEIDVRKTKITSLAFSSHKIYGPKGVGGCYIDPSVPWQSPLPNITHEGGFRAGTINLPGIAGFVTAATDSSNGMGEESQRITALRSHLIDHIEEITYPIVIESPIKDGAPHILALRVPGMEGQYVMLECNRMGVAISTGTACKVGQNAPSKTLLAMGRSQDQAHELIRLSFGKQTTVEDIDKTVKVFKEILTLKV